MPKDLAWIGIFPTTFNSGRLAVDVFFVISGFVITRILLKGKEQKVPLRYFLARRSLRIFPPYALFLLAVLALIWLWQPFAKVQMHWTQFAYLLNWHIAYGGQAPLLYSPTWSLCVEEQFYLLWPVLVYCLPREMSWRALMYLIIPGAIISTRWAPSDMWLYAATPPNFLPLSAGVIMAYHEDWARSPAARPVAVPLLLLGVLFFLPTTALFGQRIPFQVAHVMRVVLSAGIVLLCLSTIEPWTLTRLRFLRAGWITHLGIMSYGVYLYHSLAYTIVMQFARTWYTFPAGVALTLAMAGISYYLMERPLIQYAGRRFRLRAALSSAAPATAPDRRFELKPTPEATLAAPAAE